MNRFDAVFISDLHLHPDDVMITERFDQFIEWAALNTHAVYILGDLFHVWPGDDALDEWSVSIAKRFAKLASQHVNLYFMAGNRDFLVGKHFLKLACMNELLEPTVIHLDNQENQQSVLLVHGDRYCIQDKNHQKLRWLTRNRIFPALFLKLSLQYRQNLVNKIRQHSQMNRNKSWKDMEIVPDVMLKHMQKAQVDTIIHGHIHKPGLTTYQVGATQFKQFVLSDWDDKPHVLCYDKSYGFKYELI